MSYTYRFHLLVGMSVVLHALVLAQNLPFESYTVKDGLPSNTITELHQDFRGYVWIGTNNGLSRYDGVRFTNQGENNRFINPFTDSAVLMIADDEVQNAIKLLMPLKLTYTWSNIG